MGGGAEEFYGGQLGAGGVVGFYGTTPIAKQTVAQQATTLTTTQLRAELSALQNALAALGLLTVT